VKRRRSLDSTALAIAVAVVVLLVIGYARVSAKLRRDAAPAY
jgi:hypothetical protein